VRARNIKPGFFLNEELADIEAPWGRILYAGLWCMADREGRLEDRPRRIKVEIFPYDEKIPSIEKILAQLADKKFILRYNVEGEKFIQINKFKSHQNPHNTERQSTIPSPPVHGELTVDLPLPNGGNLADSLIHGFTDSLNPDSLIHGEKPSPKKSKKSETPLPEDFGISEAVKTWAAGKGFDRLDDHLEAFRDYALSRGKTYADWDSAFKRAIREDWAKLGGNGAQPQRQSPLQPNKAEQITMGNLAARDRLIKKYQERGEW
jgi:hypothetical protein